jgi:hypothetical protein
MGQIFISLKSEFFTNTSCTDFKLYVNMKKAKGQILIKQNQKYLGVLLNTGFVPTSISSVKFSS